MSQRYETGPGILMILFNASIPTPEKQVARSRGVITLSVDDLSVVCRCCYLLELQKYDIHQSSRLLKAVFPIAQVSLWTSRRT